jgi:hypothetical protein
MLVTNLGNLSERDKGRVLEIYRAVGDAQTPTWSADVVLEHVFMADGINEPARYQSVLAGLGACLAGSGSGIAWSSPLRPEMDGHGFLQENFICAGFGRCGFDGFEFDTVTQN